MYGRVCDKVIKCNRVTRKSIRFMHKIHCIKYNSQPKSNQKSSYKSIKFICKRHRQFRTNDIKIRPFYKEQHSPKWAGHVPTTNLRFCATTNSEFFDLRFWAQLFIAASFYQPITCRYFKISEKNSDWDFASPGCKVPPNSQHSPCA